MNEIGGARLALELASMSKGEYDYIVGMLAALGFPQTQRNFMFVASAMLYLKERARKGPGN